MLEQPVLAGSSNGATSQTSTASAWRMLRWACDYAALLRPMRAQAARVLTGVAELFELYLLHTFHTFAEVSCLADCLSCLQSPPLVPGAQEVHSTIVQCSILSSIVLQVSIADLATGNAGRLGVEDAVPVRLKNAIMRILSHSLPSFRTAYLPSSSQQVRLLGA